jgi:ferric-dicitrate binding protein FerR (iron transport regulator)
MKFPSPDFDDAVAAACHGTAADATLTALARLLQADDAALDEYLLRTELHATLLTSAHLGEPVDLASLADLAISDSQAGDRLARSQSTRRGLVAAGWAGATLLGLAIALTTWLSARSDTAPSQPGQRAALPVSVASTAAPSVARIIGSFVGLEGVQWVAADTIVNEGDPLRSGQRIELASGSVRLHFASGAAVRLIGPAIFEAESPLTAILTMGRVAVTADTPESKGFTIRTRTGRIVDLGTEFVAEALPDGRCRIGVSSGAVRFHPVGLEGGHLLSAGDLMEIEPGHRQVITRIERGDETPTFGFPTIEPPTADDFADAGQGRASIRCVRGQLYENPRKSIASAAPTILLDGKGQSNPDAPEESLYFADNETGGLLVDLSQPTTVKKVNVYSWHRCLNPGFGPALREAHRERAAQNYVLYGSAATEPPTVDGSPADAGWTLIARVNSDEYFGLAGIARPAQQASSITSARGPLGEYRHLLFVVQPTPGVNHDGRELNFTTFFGEIDVYAE